MATPRTILVKCRCRGVAYNQEGNRAFVCKKGLDSFRVFTAFLIIRGSKIIRTIRPPITKAGGIDVPISSCNMSSFDWTCALLDSSGVGYCILAFNISASGLNSTWNEPKGNRQEWKIARLVQSPIKFPTTHFTSQSVCRSLSDFNSSVPAAPSNRPGKILPRHFASACLCQALAKRV